MFGSEFIVIKMTVDLMQRLHYKLHMMGITVIGPTSTFCDNESVLRNVTCPEFTFKKKHNTIAYNKLYKTQAKWIIEGAKIDGKSNLTGLFTKCLLSF